MVGNQSSVPSKPKKTALSALFFGRQPTKILKIGTCKIWTHFFLHRRKFHRTQFRNFFTDVRVIFSGFKPCSGRSKCIEQWAVWKSSDAFSRFMRPKTMVFAVTLRRILKVLRLHCLQEKILGTFSRFMRPKTKLFAVKFRRISEVLRLHCLQEKILGTYSRFLCPKTKLFAVKLRRILEVNRLHCLQEKILG